MGEASQITLQLPQLHRVWPWIPRSPRVPKATERSQGRELLLKVSAAQ